MIANEIVDMYINGASVKTIAYVMDMDMEEVLSILEASELV